MSNPSYQRRSALGLFFSLSLFASEVRGQASEEPPPPVPARESPLADSPAGLQLAVPVGSVTAAGDNGDADVSDTMPGDPWGDAQGLGVIAFRALFQTRYSSTFAAKSQSSRESYKVREDYLAQHGDGWGINRALLRISSDPNQYLGLKVLLDFSELMSGDPEDVVKQAYATLRVVPERLEFVVGLFKLPYSTLELDPSSRFEIADMGAGNRLVNDLGFGGRDLGVQVMVAPLRKAKRLRLSLGAFRGHAADEHDLPAGAVAGRLETKPNKYLRFGADIVEHMQSATYNRPFDTSSKDELPNPPDPLYPAQKHWGRGRAMSVDARFKRKRFMARGEGMYGDRIDRDERYGARTFWGTWGLLAYRFDVGPVQLMPACRAEWLDTDLQHNKGMIRTLTFGLTALFLERVRILADVTRTDVEAGTVLINQPKPLQSDPYLALDNTRVTVQLQLEL